MKDTMTMTVSNAPVSLVERLDRYLVAKDLDTRSEVVLEALKEYLDRKEAF